MGFADAYLQKAGLRKALVEPEPHPGVTLIVTIPVLHESGLERCLDSLFQCTCAPLDAGTSGCGLRTEVLILVNAPAAAPPEILEHNRATLEAARAWIGAHPHPCMDFHIWLDHSFEKKEAGVGTARKILMDEAVRRFNLLDRPQGIIASMDADAEVQANYLEELSRHFNPDASAGMPPDGCSIRFEHPLSGPFSPAVYRAITQYELHLRYYLRSVRFTAYPYAFHTVGSSFAVRADIYCKEGGMNRRQGGEDFYFIQKVAQRGNFSQCNTTCVFPSPRPSGRVPFGTGPAVERLSKSGDPLLTYDPRLFGMLREFFRKLEGPWTGPLQSFLENQGFEGALEEIRANSASAAAFRKRFWRWFNMFRIMKFLHWARERGYPDVPVGEAAAALLRMIDPEHKGIPSVGTDPKKLLLIYRMLELR